MTNSIFIYLAICRDGSPHFASLQEDRLVEELEALDTPGNHVACRPHRSVKMEVGGFDPDAPNRMQSLSISSSPAQYPDWLVTRLACKTCSELVEEPGLRDHLAQHHPQANAFDWEQVRECSEATR